MKRTLYQSILGLRLNEFVSVCENKLIEAELLHNGEMDGKTNLFMLNFINYKSTVNSLGSQCFIVKLSIYFRYEIELLLRFLALLPSFCLTLCLLVPSAVNLCKQLDPDQAQHFVGPDLDPNCWTL